MRNTPSLTSETLHRKRQLLQNQGPAQPGSAFLEKCTVEISDWEGTPVYTVRSRTRADSGEKLIYLHGGGYTQPLTRRHWALVERLANDNGLTVIVPLFVLAPDGTYRQCLSRLKRLYTHLTADSEFGRPYLAGDSSGGGLAYALAQTVRDAGLLLPQHIFLFAPWLDATLVNPGIAKVEDVDPILSTLALRTFGSEWAGDDDPSVPEVSPLLGDLTGLPGVDVFIGTRDLLIADCRALEAKAAWVGAQVRVHEYRGAFHAFMLVTWLPETRSVLRTVRRVVSSRTTLTASGSPGR